MLEPRHSCGVSCLDRPGGWSSIKIIENVYFISVSSRDIHKEVLLAILSCWPAVVIAVIMTYLAGIVVWALVSHVGDGKSLLLPRVP